MKEKGTEKRVQVHVPYYMLLRKLEDVFSLGINPEVYLDGVHLDRADPEDLALIKAEADKYGLRITMHGPYMEMSPGHPEEERRIFTVEKYRRVFDVMEVLRPTNVVFHGGYDERIFKGDMDLWLKQSLKTWPEFVERAEKKGLTIGVENIFERTPDALKALVDEVGSPNFGLCIDAGHLNIFSTVKMEEWFREVGERLVEVHIHDNNGKADEHLPVGDGSIDFPLFFSLIDEHAGDIVYTIEQHGEEEVKRGLKAVSGYLIKKP